MEFLLRGEWSGNITQLKKVIRELSIWSKGYYIELPQVEDILASMKQEEEDWGGIPLSGTLKEMEREIIHRVMEEEGNNQSKAARRLGINRSTLLEKIE
ncbi:helix-turn-helix domain-containing protein [Virgibacillus halophilus]|uniref:Helix-turn-helix domain-containing protein n=1 Tax=Tigheibacillus halophilus TaxID=361280 RepID=A0ABU5C2E6_9BACI|nr:helix-turn-helix domain-containing protein [Virgibacillus halophilus]